MINYDRANGKSHINSFYEAMSWAGLHTTSAFHNLSPYVRQRILNIISIEATGKDLNNNVQNQKDSNAGC